MVHKYLFFAVDNAIKIYSYEEKKFKLNRPFGEKSFKCKDLDLVFQWFNKNSAITKKDFIDFCFISDNILDVDDLLKEYNKKDNTTWTIDEIEEFLSKTSEYNYCKILINGEIERIFQKWNDPQEKEVPQLYINCIPKLDLKEIKEVENDKIEGISPLAKHYIEELKKAQKNYR